MNKLFVFLLFPCLRGNQFPKTHYQILIQRNTSRFVGNSHCKNSFNFIIWTKKMNSEEHGCMDEDVKSEDECSLNNGHISKYGNTTCVIVDTHDKNFPLRVTEGEHLDRIRVTSIDRRSVAMSPNRTPRWRIGYGSNREESKLQKSLEIRIGPIVLESVEEVKGLTLAKFFIFDDNEANGCIKALTRIREKLEEKSLKEVMDIHFEETDGYRIKSRAPVDLLSIFYNETGRDNLTDLPPLPCYVTCLFWLHGMKEYSERVFTNMEVVQMKLLGECGTKRRRYNSCIL